MSSYDVVDRWVAPQLTGRVVLVTGASRGVGRGIAAALGDAGATVYVTGRSTRAGTRTENLPGTIEDTAELVTRRGGRGVAVRCDHSREADVVALFERIRQEEGRLDVLVNNAWPGYERSTEVRFDAPFWEQPSFRYEAFAAALHGQYVTSQHAARLMIPKRAGLIVNVGFTDAGVYLGQAAYDVFKTASDRLSFAMAMDLRKFEVVSLALHPGFVLTERVVAAASAMGSGPASVVHSPEYVGRAICHLLQESSLLEMTGQAYAVGDLAQRYGFCDVNGAQPPAFHLEGRLSLATRMDRLNRAIQAQANSNRVKKAEVAP